MYPDAAASAWDTASVAWDSPAGSRDAESCGWDAAADARYATALYRAAMIYAPDLYKCPYNALKMNEIVKIAVKKAAYRWRAVVMWVAWIHNTIFLKKRVLCWLITKVQIDF